MDFDRRLALMAGTDLPVPDLQLTLHQPTIKEISYVGDSTFFLGVQCLAIDKEVLTQDKTLLDKTSNFQIFMMVMADQEEAEKKYAVNQVLSLIVPDYKVSFLPPRSLVFYKNDNTITLDENNFEVFQNYIKDIFCLNNQNNTQNFNPKGDKAKEIADKLMRARQRVAAQKGGREGSVFVEYVSVLAVGLGSMSLEDCLNLTMYQMFDLMERYSLWLNWDLDIKSRLAGGKPDSKPDNWMKNIH